MAIAPRFTVGDGILASTTVRGPDGEPVDPVSIVLMVRDPEGTETTYPAEKIEAGRYQVLWFADKPGTWYRRWKARNAENVSLGVDEASVIVERSAFATP